MFCQKGRIVFLGDSTQNDTLESLIGLQHPRLSAESLNMGHSRYTRQAQEHNVINSYRERLSIVDTFVVDNFRLSAESHHLASDLILETEHNADREYHNGKSHSNAADRDGYCRT